jgi:hypothetical protein
MRCNLSSGFFPGRRKIEKDAKRRTLVVGVGVAFLLSAPLMFCASGMRVAVWFGNLALDLSMPGFLGATLIGPLAQVGVHSDHPRMFWSLVFVLNIAILWIALFFVLNLIERFTNQK